MEGLTYPHKFMHHMSRHMDEIVKQFLKPIYLDDAPSPWVKRAFADDGDDYIAYVEHTAVARVTEAATKVGMDIIDPRFAERIGKDIVKAKPQLLSEGFNGWWDIIFRAFATTLKPSESRKPGRPQEHVAVAQTYADVEYLRRKTGQRVRSISRWLPQAKAYKERYENVTPDAIRERHGRALTLTNSNPQFKILLCGLEASIRGNDPTEAAIERHALKPAAKKLAK
jgi:hypothetical protein